MCTLLIFEYSVYADGTVCVSILVSCSIIPNQRTLTALPQHAPGDDQYGYEDAGERWMPVHTVESIVRTLSDLHGRCF